MRPRPLNKNLPKGAALGKNSDRDPARLLYAEDVLAIGGRAQRRFVLRMVRRGGTGQSGGRVMYAAKELATQFLTLLDEEASAFTFQTFDDDKSRKDPALARVMSGSLDECWDDLVGLSQRGAGVFVTVNETDKSGRKAENIVAVRAIFQGLPARRLPEGADHERP